MCWYNFINSKVKKASFEKRGIYPFTSILLFATLFLVSLLPACKPDNLKTGTKLQYFDIEGYFKSETARLKKLNHPVFKTVMHNNITESKIVHINDWQAELSLFSESDINKPAWEDGYTIQNTSNAIFYRAKTFDLKTQLIVINKSGNRIKWIYIYNKIPKNLLYQSDESLSYFPDSVYIIRKDQKVRFLQANHYRIAGTLN
jgi:hypothetical protein